MRVVKKKAHENLTDENISKVIGLLRQDSPITKKEACELLNIRYNTTRLQNIIDDFEQTLARKERFKAEKRGKAASQEEISQVVRGYIDGQNVSTIAEGMYRSPAFVKNIINRLGVPQKQPSNYNKKRDTLLPDECVANEFQVGEKVWLPRENNFGIIKYEITVEYQRTKPGLSECDYLQKYGAKGYRVDVLTPCDLNDSLMPWIDGRKAGYNSFALAYDIGSIRHLEQYL